MSSILNLDAPTAVFVLLGKKLESPPSPEYTHNWVNFEVGVAAGSTKPVWAFEQEGDSIRFPMPYVTDYMTYVLNDKNHGRKMAELFKSRIAGGLRRRTQPPVRCSNCNATYNYWSDSSEINCPVCRGRIPVTRKA